VVARPSSISHVLWDRLFSEEAIPHAPYGRACGSP
jgi:hypothetical protein